jgi:hypothetical protein
MLRFECWKAGGDFEYCYTEDRIIADELKAEFKPATTYGTESKIYAWQFLIPSRILPLLKKKLGQILDDRTITTLQDVENLSIENKELTVT